MAAIDEITIPGGVCVFFTETGGTERLLGNIVGDSVSIDRDSDEIEHFTNKSGIRRKDKIFTIEENAQIDFELDEINVNNLRYFFKGATISNVGAGTTAIVDQIETLTAEQYISVEQPGLTSVSVRQYLDSVFLDTLGTGVTFTDFSAEADTAAGTPFEINADDNDILYCGKQTQFKELDIDVDTASSGYTGDIWEYWDGSAWQTLTMTGTDDFTTDVTLTFTVPGDWATTTINGVSQYWIRFRQTAASPATPATLNSIGRQGLTEHTDYDVDPGAATATNQAQNGSVRRIAAGALVTGEKVKVSFTYVTFTSQTFGIAEQSILEGSARFISAPQAGRGTTWEMIIPKAQLKNNGSMDLDDTDFQTIPLSLVLLDDSANTAVNPFGTIRVTPV